MLRSAALMPDATALLAQWLEADDRIRGWLKCRWCHTAGEPNYADWHDGACPIGALAQMQVEIDKRRHLYDDAEPYADWPVSRFLFEATQLACPEWAWRKVKEIEEGLEALKLAVGLVPLSNLPDLFTLDEFIDLVKSGTITRMAELATPPYSIP